MTSGWRVLREFLVWVLFLGVVGGFVTARYQHVYAEEKPAQLPALTDVQKLQVLNASKDLEIAQLRLEAARLAMQTLLAAVTPAGYQITDKLELAPLPVPPKEK